MIVVKYTGGLGNQMFQYALSAVLAQKYPEEIVYADLGRYNITLEHDGFDLIKYFDISINVIPEKDMKYIEPVTYLLKYTRLNKLFFNRFTGKIEKLNEKFINKNNFGIVKDYYSTSYNENAFYLDKEKINNWLFKGNWINPEYFKGYEDIILKQFNFKYSLLGYNELQCINRMEKSNSVSIHIRKGDYKGNYKYDLCNCNYYKKAIKELEAKSLIKTEKMKFYIFVENEENDIIECLDKDNIEIISHPKSGGIDMWLMSKCKYNIIANSTFSYWGALLNDYEEKIVIAPKYMYRNYATLVAMPVPVGWIQINNLEDK